jgi:hypothetical protein
MGLLRSGKQIRSGHDEFDLSVGIKDTGTVADSSGREWRTRESDGIARFVCRCGVDATGPQPEIIAMARSHLLEDDHTMPQLTPTDPDDPMQQSPEDRMVELAHVLASSNPPIGHGVGGRPMLLGKVAFSAYSDHTGGKSYNGEDLPHWDDLPATVQLAWCAAAVAVQVASKGKARL